VHPSRAAIKNAAQLQRGASAFVLLWLLPADLPDRARAGDLHERTVGSSHELRGRIRLTEVPHRAVIHEVRTWCGRLPR
jgi:hypothetical protein